MSQYNETIGSFIRTGGYPLEANYIFNSYEDLVNFYEDPVNKATLHIGLFKVVLSDNGTQSLYWITNNNGSLQFTQLLDTTTIEDLSILLLNINSRLIREIADRKEIIDGTINILPKDLNNLLKITEVISTLSEDNKLTKDSLEYLHQLVEILNPDEVNSRINQLKTELITKLASLWDELNNTLTGVGLDSSGLYSPDLETHYLKNATSIMNALKTLDSIIYNIAIMESGITSGIKSGYYDSETEELVLELNTSDDTELLIRIPVGALIREWTPDNSLSKVVVLDREEVINGTDKLSADVRISEKQDNILVKDDNTLYVKGTTDNIIHTDGKKLSTVLENISYSEDLKLTIDRVDSIWRGDKDLVAPTIEGTWKVYNQDNEEITPTPSFPLEKGFKAKFTGTWKWVTNENKKNPEITSGTWGDELPDSNVSSQPFTSPEYITSGTTYSQTVKAATLGLVVLGGKVVPATGQDTRTASVSISFSDRVYYGELSEITPDNIKSLTTALGSKARTFNNITVSDYFVYAYPKSLGTISRIILDGATPVLGAFTLIEGITIINSAGAEIPLYVYKSNNPGAFTNNTLKFE